MYMYRELSIFVFLSFLITILPKFTDASSLNDALTIWGSKVELIGINQDIEIKLKRKIKRLMKEYAFHHRTRVPTTRFTISIEGSNVVLKVKSLLTFSVLFEDRAPIKTQNFVDIKEATELLFNKFVRKMPTIGVVSEVTGSKVYLGVGANRKLKKGRRLIAVRFKGTASQKIDLNKDMPYELTARLKIIEVREYESVAKIINSSGLKRFDKIKFDKKASRKKNLQGYTDGLETGIKVLGGFASGYLRTKPTEDFASSEEIEPDNDKKLTPISLVPLIGMEWWFLKILGVSLEFQYRKIPLTTSAGESVKANYLLGTFDLNYRYDVNPDEIKDIIAANIGYFDYRNTLNKDLIRYISIRYYGPQLGLGWKRVDGPHAGFFQIIAYPYLWVKEDRIKRGTSATAYGFNVNSGYEHRFKNNLGFKIAPYYRWIKTTFKGPVSFGITNEKHKFLEFQYGIKFLLSFTIPY